MSKIIPVNPISSKISININTSHYFTNSNTFSTAKVIYIVLHWRNEEWYYSITKMYWVSPWISLQHDMTIITSNFRCSNKEKKKEKNRVLTLMKLQMDKFVHTNPSGHKECQAAQDRTAHLSPRHGNLRAPRPRAVPRTAAEARVGWGWGRGREQPTTAPSTQNYFPAGYPCLLPTLIFSC